MKYKLVNRILFLLNYTFNIYYIIFYFFIYSLEGKHLPLPPAMNGTQWGQATMARNLEKGCPSNKPCSNVICPDPFECVDLWNVYECT